MKDTKPRKQRRKQVKRRVRAKVSGTPEKPRLSIFKSNRHLIGQLIDDESGETLVYVSSHGDEENVNQEIAKDLGQELGEKAIDQGIEQVAFDRNGFPYHGQIKSFAEGAREAGLEF